VPPELEQPTEPAKPEPKDKAGGEG